MSFRKRNIGLTTPSSTSSTSPQTLHPTPIPIPGIRPSPLDGRPTTSTGTPSLDDLLAGHAGLALGNSLLIEENGTTDFAGALLRYDAAEGVVQGHRVHVVGVQEGWGRELPGLLGRSGGGEKGEEGSSGVEKEKMKIAWRYERLGEVGGGGGTAGLRAPPTPTRGPIPPGKGSGQAESTTPAVFTHSFDLTKRLTVPPGSITYMPISPYPNSNPFQYIIPSVTHSLNSTPPTTIHRLIIPNLLSPALYPPHSSIPTHLLPFLHSLRALLRSHPTCLSAMLTLPLSLHPRSTGLVRWIEHLCDGVLELAPFPHTVEIEPPSRKAGKGESENPQGMVKVHKLPVLTEKGGGGGGGDDLAFSLSRRRFVVRKFSLPPVVGDEEAQKGEVKGDIEF